MSNISSFNIDIDQLHSNPLVLSKKYSPLSVPQIKKFNFERFKVADSNLSALRTGSTTSDFGKQDYAKSTYLWTTYSGGINVYAYYDKLAHYEYKYDKKSNDVYRDWLSGKYVGTDYTDWVDTYTAIKDIYDL
jgi:hypothetical protein